MHQGKKAETSDVVAGMFLTFERNNYVLLIPTLLIYMLTLELYVLLLFPCVEINFDVLVISF